MDVLPSQLKPRSNRQLSPPDAVVNSPVSSSPNTIKKTKPNPFGSAKPRELILQQRGVDVQSLDAKFEAKVHAAQGHVDGLTPSQQAQVEAVRQSLTRLELQWRDANEKELPEEKFRLAVEAKRDELHTLLQQIDKDNKNKKKPSERSPQGGRSTTTTFGEEPPQHGFTTVGATNQGRGRIRPPHGW